MRFEVEFVSGEDLGGTPLDALLVDRTSLRLLELRLDLNLIPVADAVLEKWVSSATSLTLLEVHDARNEPAVLCAVGGVVPRVRFSRSPGGKTCTVTEEHPEPFTPPHFGVERLVVRGAAAKKTDGLRAFSETVPYVREITAPMWPRAMSPCWARLFPALLMVVLADGRTTDGASDNESETDSDSDSCFDPSVLCCEADALPPGVSLVRKGGVPVPRGQRCACRRCSHASALAWLLVSGRLPLCEPLVSMVVRYDQYWHRLVPAHSPFVSLHDASRFETAFPPYGAR